MTPSGREVFEVAVSLSHSAEGWVGVIIFSLGAWVGPYLPGNSAWENACEIMLRCNFDGRQPLVVVRIFCVAGQC